LTSFDITYTVNMHFFTLYAASTVILQYRYTDIHENGKKDTEIGPTANEIIMQ